MSFPQMKPSYDKYICYGHSAKLCSAFDPLLYSSYTHDCHDTQSNIFKFNNDITIVEWITVSMS